MSALAIRSVSLLSVAWSLFGPARAEDSLSRTRRCAPLEPSIVLRHEGDYQDVKRLVARAAELGCRHLNFVITVNCEISAVNQVTRYGLAKRTGRKFMLQPMNDEVLAKLTAYYREAIAAAVSAKMKLAILCHLDIAKRPYVWRNYFQFDPLAEYEGYSYQSTLIDPLVAILADVTPPGYRVDFSLAGEMGTSIFAHPSAYAKLMRYARSRLADKQLAVGVSFNFNNVQGKYESEGSVNRPLQDLIEQSDFIGFSNYHEVSVPPTAEDFCQSIESFAADLARNGVTLPADARLHFSEIAVGGYGRERFTTDPREAAVALYEGTQDPRKSPWKNERMRRFRVNYHRALLEFLARQTASWPVEIAFLWSDASWDPQGLSQPAFADEEIIRLIRAHNQRAASQL